MDNLNFYCTDDIPGLGNYFLITTISGDYGRNISIEVFMFLLNGNGKQHFMERKFQWDFDLDNYMREQEALNQAKIDINNIKNDMANNMGDHGLSQRYFELNKLTDIHDLIGDLQYNYSEKLNVLSNESWSEDFRNRICS